jgi:hypothetical protein
MHPNDEKDLLDELQWSRIQRELAELYLEWVDEEDE